MKVQVVLFCLNKKNVSLLKSCCYKFSAAVVMLKSVNIFVFI